MNEPFYASIKLTTGEEILTEVYLTEEKGEEVVLLSEPVVVDERSYFNDVKNAYITQYVPRKWLVTSNEDLIILKKEHIITMTEVDKFGKQFYLKSLLAAKVSSPIKRELNTEEHTGFLGSIEKQREYLESLFNEEI